MDLVQAIVLAFIQGISAWIPISSKTQVVLAGTSLFGMTLEAALAFALALHVGDFIAALAKYRSEYVHALKQLAHPATLLRFDTDENQQESRFLVLSIIATALIALPAYLLLKKHFAGLSGEPLLFLIGLVLLAMAALTWHAHQKPRSEKTLDLKTTLITGAAQGLAVIPGISRSGITQSALLIQGVKPEKAMRLSFLMSAPMIAAAIVAFYFVTGFGTLSILPVVIGIAVAALISWLTMDALTKMAAKIPAHYFLAAIGILAMVPAVLQLTLHVAG